MLRDKQRAKLKIPALGAEPNELLAYRDEAFGSKTFGNRNTLRCRKLENAARNLLYFYGRQWIKLDNARLLQGSRGYHFQDIPNKKKIPQPVFNIIAPAVNIEMAALGRGKLTSSVRPTSRDPRVQAAAKVANDILQYRLKDLQWADKRAQFTFLDIVCGLSIIKSFWDESFETIGYFANPNAKQCLTCGFTSGNHNGQLEGQACPYCQQEGLQQLLESLEVTKDLASEPDSEGSPLGIPAPKGQTALEVVSPFDFYPDNSGIDQDWYGMKLWRQATPRHMDYVLARYPELADRLEPDDPRELMQNHPVLGDFDIYGRYDNALDADLYANHVMLYEIYQDRSIEFPNGRAIVIAGDEIALDSELYRKVGPNSVKLVCYAGVNWEQKHREIWGKALVDDLISPQNVYNGLCSLELEAIARTGSPNIILPMGMTSDGPEFFEPYDNVGKFIRYPIDPLNPQAKPEILGGVATPPVVNKAKEEALSLAQIIQGPSAIERGEAPKNITTTSGLQFLDEQSDKRRGYRIDALTNAFKTIYKHQLSLLWTLRVDDDFYEAESEDGTWELIQYNKQSLMGQVNVEIENQTEVDKSLYQREAVREAHADGLYTGTGPSLGLSAIERQRLLELRGLPTEVVEAKNHQIEMVKQRWVDFVDKGSLPVIDPTTDDFQIQFEGFKNYLTTQEGRRISESMGWNSILKLIAGWESRLAQIELADQLARDFYKTDNLQLAMPMYEQAQVQFQQAQVEYEQAQQQAGKLVQSGADPMQVQAAAALPPQAPPPPLFLQGDKADHIYGVWAQMILEKGGLPAPIGVAALDVETIAKQDNYLKFRALVDAYRLLIPTQGGMVAEPQQNPALAGSNPGINQLAVQSKSF